MRHGCIPWFVATTLILSLIGQFEAGVNAAYITGRNAVTVSDSSEMYPFDGAGYAYQHMSLGFPYFGLGEGDGFMEIIVDAPPPWNGNIYSNTGQELVVGFELEPSPDLQDAGYADAIRCMIAAPETKTVTLNIDYEYELDLTDSVRDGYITFAVAFWQGNPWSWIITPQENLLLNPGNGWNVSTQDIAEIFPVTCESLGGTTWSVLEKTIYVNAGESTSLISLSDSWEIPVVQNMEYSYLTHIEVGLNETEPSEPPWPHEPFTFVHISDPHIGHTSYTRIGPFVIPHDETTNLDATVSEILRLTPKPDFVLVTGDVADYACSLVLSRCAGDHYDRFLESMDRLLDGGITYYVVPGNHDRARRFPCGGAPNWLTCTDDLRCYFEAMGYPFDRGCYSFVNKGILFIGLDSGEGYPRGVGLSDPQFDYLNYIGHYDPDKPKVLFMHHPAIDKWGDDQSIARTVGVTSDGATINFFQWCEANKVRLVLSGHTHQDHISDGDGSPIPNDPDWTKPAYVQTPGSGIFPFRECSSWFEEEETIGYRVIDVENGLAKPRSYTPTRRQYARLEGNLCSPGNLHIYDSRGRHVGVTPGGSVEFGIPDSFHHKHYTIETEEGIDVFPEKILIFDPSGGYLWEVAGTELGTYQLKITSVNSGEEIMFEAAGIPTSPGSRHLYMVDWSALSDGGEGVFLEIDADGDGEFERSITSDRELTADEFNGVPVANAGPDQTVESTSHEGAVVTLDGSGSTDVDSTPGTNDDILHFDWWEGNNPLWSGEIIDYLFPLGGHTVSLYVTDSLGWTDSDDVIITVVEPQTLESQLWITPTVIDRNVGGGQITAKLSLPDGIGKDQIDLDQSLLLYPGEIEAIRQHASQRGSQRKPKTTVYAFFDKKDLLDAVPDDGQVELQVVGQLKTGQWFSGSDNVKIATKKKASKKTSKK